MNRLLAIAHKGMLALTLCTSIACNSADPGAQDHPAVLIGGWERQLDSSTWGKTLVFRADGKVVGSASNNVPPTAYWYVSHNGAGGDELCVGDGRNSSCQTYMLANQILTVHSSAGQVTNFRRVR
jgi:hypothetical protein